jgi:hypothetical protein
MVYTGVQGHFGNSASRRFSLPQDRVLRSNEVSEFQRQRAIKIGAVPLNASLPPSERVPDDMTAFLMAGEPAMQAARKSDPSLNHSAFAEPFRPGAAICRTAGPAADRGAGPE